MSVEEILIFLKKNFCIFVGPNKCFMFPPLNVILNIKFDFIRYCHYWMSVMECISSCTFIKIITLCSSFIMWYCFQFGFWILRVLNKTVRVINFVKVHLPWSSSDLSYFSQIFNINYTCTSKHIIYMYSSYIVPDLYIWVVSFFLAYWTFRLCLFVLLVFLFIYFLFHHSFIRTSRVVALNV